MSPQLARVEVIHSSFPRVSGDEPPVCVTSYTATRFSPRERG